MTTSNQVLLPCNPAAVRRAAVHENVFLKVPVCVQLLDRAAAWARLAGCADTVHFHLANATVSLHSMLSSYPGPIELINIQVCNHRIALCQQDELVQLHVITGFEHHHVRLAEHLTAVMQVCIRQFALLPSFWHLLSSCQLFV